ncbi:hypothetical protein BWI97_00635 [Siphonobacter sp. BAB-5405]|uniref:hypothetical protein n=1 Tax=Siphonobacter sp. BAB-5405 TaxID=1864825 RepID=UPI000C7F7E52|nr:hypothetical protein [Siphonobacter sp. BAB-5405]PMD99495.1 hypothetical protein BWI97_00635 [Siphonobacter sp. BAB-5405]
MEGTTPAEEAELKQARQAATLAKARAERVEAEKRIAETRVAEIRTLTGERPTNPLPVPSGSILVGEGVQFPQITESAHQQLRVLMRQVYTDNQTILTAGTRLIIYQESDVMALSNYQLILQQLQSLNTSIQTTLDQAREVLEQGRALLENKPLAQSQNLGMGWLAAPALATGVVQSLAELVQLFRKEVEIRSQPVTLSEEDAVALLQKELQGSQAAVTLFYPRLYPVRVRSESVVLRTLSELSQLLERTTETNLDLEAFRERLATWAGNEAEKMFQARQRTQTVDALKTALASYQQTGTKIWTDLQVTESPVSTLASLRQIEQLHQVLQEPAAYHLRLQISSQGSYQVTKRLWRNAVIEYHASVEVNYMLFQSTGQVLRADKLSSYGAFRKS